MILRFIYKHKHLRMAGKTLKAKQIKRIYYEHLVKQK